MRKNYSAFLVFFLTILGVSSVAAQDIKYGFRAGLNYSELQYDSENSLILGEETFNFDNGRIGAAIGFFAKINLPGDWSLQPELQYSAQGEKTAGLVEQTGLVTLGESVYTEDFFKINALQLPVLVNYEVARNFEVSAGPQLALTVWEWEREDEYEFVSLSALAGVTYNFNENFSASLRASYGLTDILRADTVIETADGQEIPFKENAVNHYLQLSLAYSI